MCATREGRWCTQYTVGTFILPWFRRIQQILVAFSTHTALIPNTSQCTITNNIVHGCAISIHHRQINSYPHKTPMYLLRCIRNPFSQRSFFLSLSADMSATFLSYWALTCTKLFMWAASLSCSTVLKVWMQHYRFWTQYCTIGCVVLRVILAVLYIVVRCTLL